MSTSGYVYIIYNEAMPGILKVGYTTKDSHTRAKQLAGAGSPLRFHVFYEALVENPRTVEQATHAALASKHVAKEWFRCSKKEAVAAIRACAKDPLREHFYVQWTKESNLFKMKRHKP